MRSASCARPSRRWASACRWTTCHDGGVHLRRRWATGPAVSRWLPWRSRDELSDRRVEDLELLALDIETTGLDPARHEVLSFGMVPVRRLTIELAEARQYAVRPVRGAGVGDSATVHGITDDVAA